MMMWRVAAVALVLGACDSGSGGSSVDAQDVPLYVMTWTVVAGRTPAPCPADAVVSVVFTVGDEQAGGLTARCTEGSGTLGALDLGPHCECGLLLLFLSFSQRGVAGVFEPQLPEHDGVVKLPVVFDVGVTIPTRDQLDR